MAQWHDRGALSSLNLANNKIGQLVPPAGWSSAKQFNSAGVDGFKSPSGKWQAEAPQGSKPEGAIALANAIKDMGAMTSLNLASNNLRAMGAKIVAGAIKVTKCTPAAFWYHFHVHLTSQSTAVVCYYPQDMGALSVANVMGNKIGKVQLAKPQEIMRAKPSLVSLCGMADDATEADLSGLGMDADGAIVLASELPDKGALSLLNLADNSTGEASVQKIKEMCGSRNISLLIN
jgi:hypothetical protein